MTTFDRRTFLRRSGALGAGLVGANTLQTLMTRVAAAEPLEQLRSPGNGGYGPLQPAGPELHLPAGFTYVAFGREGTPMSTLLPTPPRHDGMAAFAGPTPGTVRLVRNHEVGRGGAFGLPAYDEQAGGGTTTLLFDTVTQTLLGTWPSLAGTYRNCAGGATPWGTWLSCEEAVNGPQVETLQRPHGYVFEVPADALVPVAPEPLRAMGRFVHEAVAVDPATSIVYETEDRQTSGVYRFRPAVPGQLAEGGTLQMLAVDGTPRYDTRRRQRVGTALPVTWVDIDEPDPPNVELDDLAVYRQGVKRGAATFGRGEGAFFSDGVAYVVITNGGDSGLGQVWALRPDAERGDTLTLVFESPSSKLLQAPDNLAVSPRGGLLLCEDGGSTDFLRGIDRDGRIFDFGKNALNDSEFCGATFSPDGQTLFVNIQTPGVTLAITGPWERGAL
jgi:secreted PhoX family phosphatase